MRSKLSLSLLLYCSLLIPGASAQDWAKTRLEKSPRHLEYVDVRHGNRTVKCYVAYPEKPGKVPAVLVIHEIFGLSDWARLLADELAEAGFLAIVPDLLSGTGPQGGGTREFAGDDAAREAVGKLPQDQVTADLDATYDYLKAIPACNGRISLAGFCWGGTQSFLYATHNAKVQKVMVFYGTAPKEVSELKKIAAPVYGFYAENDGRIGATVPDTSKNMQTARKQYDPVTYPGAGHGFMRAGDAPDASAPNKAARNLAWERLKKLLKGS